MSDWEKTYDATIQDEAPEAFTEADLTKILEVDGCTQQQKCDRQMENQQEEATSDELGDSFRSQADFHPEALSSAENDIVNPSPELLEGLSVFMMESPSNDPIDEYFERNQPLQSLRESPVLPELGTAPHLVALNTAPVSYPSESRNQRCENSHPYTQVTCPFRITGINSSGRQDGISDSLTSSLSSSNFNMVDQIIGQAQLPVVSNHEPKTIYDELNDSGDLGDFSFDQEVPEENENAFGLDVDDIIYTEPTDLDVLLGRGARSNQHPGNAKYHQEKLKIQPKYRVARKEEKTGISQELVDIVHAYGGRFLELDKDSNNWFEVENSRARKKASQALREENTPEKRARKRMLYPPKSKPKKQKH